MSHIEVTVIKPADNLDKALKVFKLLMETYDEVTINIKKPDADTDQPQLPASVSNALREGHFHKALALYHVSFPEVPFEDAKKSLMTGVEWSGWDKWEGGEQPIPNGILVEVILRDADIPDGLSEAFTWKHNCTTLPKEQEIVGYRVTGW